MSAAAHPGHHSPCCGSQTCCPCHSGASGLPGGPVPPRSSACPWRPGHTCPCAARRGAPHSALHPLVWGSPPVLRPGDTLCLHQTRPEHLWDAWSCVQALQEGGKWASMGPSLTMASHQNSATSPILMELSSVSQISSLNILPTMISMGMPASRLSSITVRSKSSFSVWKWKVNCPRESPV